MKKLIVISSLIIVTFASCNNSQNRVKEDKATPEALKEENLYNVSSKRVPGDILENLYGELAEKTPELTDLENKLDTLSAGKNDSIKSFERYANKNEAYYSNADESHVKQINDSILRKKMQSLISSSLARYNAKIYRHTELLKSIEKRTLTLEDLHQILIITTTLPLIEKYQNDNLYTINSINGYSKQLDKVLRLENTLIEKNSRKEKKE